MGSSLGIGLPDHTSGIRLGGGGAAGGAGKLYNAAGAGRLLSGVGGTAGRDDGDQQIGVLFRARQPQIG